MDFEFWLFVVLTQIRDLSNWWAFAFLLAVFCRLELENRKWSRRLAVTAYMLLALNILIPTEDRFAEIARSHTNQSTIVISPIGAEEKTDEK